MRADQPIDSRIARELGDSVAPTPDYRKELQN
ncbi:hypothetical protein HALDL1_14910 [Halobacterium sp. DL1]|jgi:hypothetical protein|nr:hypothetical protein HALDL1_14910 [Halobacterium sp. DL1]